MVKRVVITNYLGESVEYKIEGANVENNNGLLITEIEGLGPPNANLIFTNLVNIDGSLYNSGKVEARNIIIKARFTWANTIEEARLSSYRFFPLKKPLRFEVETDNRKAYVVGYVEKNEANIFSSEEDVQISVLCEDAYLKDTDEETEIFFSCIEPLFEFVYENEGFELNTEFGNRGEKTVNTITNQGDVAVGYTIRLQATGLVTNPSIYFINTQEKLTFDTGRIAQVSGAKNFDDGDEIILTMLERQKSCYFLNGQTGQYVNILNLVDTNFSWPKLTPGPTNLYHCQADGGEDYLRFFIDYQAVYEGV